MDEDVSGGGDVVEDEEVLFSMICRTLVFNPCLQNSITGLMVSRMYLVLLLVNISLNWLWVT